MEELVSTLQRAQADLEPQFAALRATVGALKAAVRLASEEKADALPMQKALAKLEAAAANVENESLATAVAAFAAQTQTALDNLAFDFAQELRTAFQERGEVVEGRPPRLGVGILLLEIDIAARKGQWFYGREPLTRPIPLSLKGILKAYDQQTKRIVQREVDIPAFVEELAKAWEDCRAKRTKSTSRINVVEVYAQLILNRQNNRFWNAPARRTFKDYERELFVRDLVLAREDGAANHFRLSVSTKSQTEQTSRSIWLPDTAADGQYYSDLIFA